MKIATIVGARPQFIKASTISRVVSNQDKIREVMIHTGQHYDANMSDIFFAELDIRKPDYHLGIGGGTHGENTGRMLEAIEKVLISENPDWVLVYGDTDSTLAGTLAAVKLHIPLAHIEAGLRSFNRRMPEEVNRVLSDHAADLLFAPTQTAVRNLAREGIIGDKVKLVGDVMYDATLHYRSQARRPNSVDLLEGTVFYLCTIHRAENTDHPERLADIVSMINLISKEITVILPLHPRTVAAIQRMEGISFDHNVQIISPLGYLEMTWLLSNCRLVITDSGGLQKEAFFHRKPCITLRDQTEWIELVDAGWNRLMPLCANFNADFIHNQSKLILEDQENMYGVGDTAQQIIEHISLCQPKS